MGAYVGAKLPRGQEWGGGLEGDMSMGMDMRVGADRLSLREVSWIHAEGMLLKSLQSDEAERTKRGTGEGSVQAGTTSPPVILTAELATGLCSPGLRASV